MTPHDDAPDPQFPAPDSDEELFVSTPSEGVYVFHTNEADEFIRIDIVVEPLKHR